MKRANHSVILELVQQLCYARGAVLHPPNEWMIWYLQTIEDLFDEDQREAAKLCMFVCH